MYRCPCPMHRHKAYFQKINKLDEQKNEIKIQMFTQQVSRTLFIVIKPIKTNMRGAAGTHFLCTWRRSGPSERDRRQTRNSLSRQETCWRNYVHHVSFYCVIQWVEKVKWERQLWQKKNSRKPTQKAEIDTDLDRYNIEAKLVDEWKVDKNSVNRFDLRESFNLNRFNPSTDSASTCSLLKLTKPQPV